MTDQDLNLYASELRAIESATEQLYELLKRIKIRSHDKRLREWLTQEANDTLAHSQELATLARGADSGAPVEPCEAMQCMVRSVTAHLHAAEAIGIEQLDREIVSACQRTLQFQATRLGTASAHAKHLNKVRDAEGLEQIVSDMYREIATAEHLAVTLKDVAHQTPASTPH